MATYIKTLSDKDGNVILPKTRSSCVYMGNNMSVEEMVWNEMPRFLQDRIPINLNTDVDIYLNSGCYLCNNGTIANSLSNPPWTTSGFLLDVMKLGNNNTKQIAIGYGSARIAMRFYNGSWTNWVEFLSSDNTRSQLNVFNAKREFTFETLNDPNMKYTYTANIDEATAVKMGMPKSWYHLLNFSHTNDDGFSTQLAFSYTGTYDNIIYRKATGLKWGPWREICVHGQSLYTATTPPTSLRDNQVCLVYQ